MEKTEDSRIDPRDFLKGRENLIEYLLAEVKITPVDAAGIVDFLIRNNYISDWPYIEAYADRDGGEF